MNRPHPADAFAGDDNAPTVDFAAIVQQISEIKPRALTPAQYEDVVVLIEYMRDEVVKAQRAVQERNAMLDARERDLEQREKQVSIKMRAAVAGIKTRATLGQRMRRYFGGKPCC